MLDLPDFGRLPYIGLYKDLGFRVKLHSDIEI